MRIPSKPVTGDRTDSRVLEHLPAGECWRLVGQHGIGRLGFMGESHVQIVPTVYDADRGTAYFRATTFGKLARRVHGKVTTLQTDEIDPATFAGWSVTLTGTACRVEDANTLVSLTSRTRPPTWTPGTSSQWIALTAETIEGQRVRT